MTALIVAAGMSVGLGLYLVLRGSLRRTVALGDALALLDPPPAVPVGADGADGLPRGVEELRTRSVVVADDHPAPRTRPPTPSRSPTPSPPTSTPSSRVA